MLEDVLDALFFIFAHFQKCLPQGVRRFAEMPFRKVNITYDLDPCTRSNALSRNSLVELRFPQNYILLSCRFFNSFIKLNSYRFSYVFKS